MSRPRSLATAAGVLFLITHVTSVPAALVLYRPVLEHSDFVFGAGSDTAVRLGALLEIVLAVAVVGTGAALYPLVRRRHEAHAVAYATLRTLEAGVILVGVLSLLAVVSLRVDAPPGADPGALTGTAGALVAAQQWSFLVGPNFVLCASTATLAYALLRSSAVPRWIPMFGLVGSASLLCGAIAVLFGRIEQVSLWGALAAAPVMVWELSLAIRLITRGVDEPAEVTDTRTRPVAAI